MDNEMRDRLIEIISYTANNENVAELAANNLIENGAIFPKFKIGQVVWFLWPSSLITAHKVYAFKMEDKIKYKISVVCGYIKESELFATEAEARADLNKRMAKNG